MKNSIFITGTDTDIGKTFVSLGIALKLQEKSKKIGYFKPFQSGAYEKDNKLYAPDIEEFREYKNINTKFSYLFKGEISPHLASILSNVDVDIEKVKKDFENFSAQNDFTIIEGAGGLYCPAYKGKTFIDVIKALKQDIIIVSTPDLGRLNHLLMTIDCAKRNNINIKGIVINKMPVEKTLSQENFIKELKMFCDEEILGIIPKLENPDKASIIQAFQQIKL